MLVLTRKHNESIVIDPSKHQGLIRITVVDVRGDKCRLGIEAHSSVPVHREEVFQSMQRNGEITPSLANRNKD